MKNKALWITIGVLVAAGVLTIFLIYGKQEKQTPPVGRGAMDGASRPVPVAVAIARTGDIDVVINALGTVTARNTVTIKPRVDGQLVRVAFREGQLVEIGDLLAEIDPRSFQSQLDQANGQLMRDQALLANAALDQARYRGLLAKDSIAKQQVDAQAALVRQYEGVVKTDRALVDNAKLQLAFTHVTAPIAGRLGLRLVDTGNMVRTTDTGGLVVITQTQPITVIFSIPSDNLAAVMSKLQANQQLTVEAWDRDDKNKLAIGTLLTIDNQIDATTGTVKLKAEFTNSDNALFPNQFVNIHLRIETRHGVTLVPTSASQRGTQGTFFYVVDESKTVSLRPVVLGQISGNIVAVEKGLAPGEKVVIDGADKLRQGAKVEISSPGERSGESKGPPKGDRRQNRRKPPAESKNGA
ncbi:MdtA/MuxA family multidrug efflux RND transporter periplasmic adaptor subunit [Candidatus Nitrotoga sp. 1052]|uniref:MdtA/MuxA family multidrug efflux RND transporter periplasmic adaptor subunit n=1 Tax=Candidatus Nitrotoga sp. 1052 TaxID=2886964 RepID=UPI001EF3F316|nr:MdtA/MuxA family multidrug efflux RND transporter periplasmic adaptor subunit [Candidatus Nitrotoga sp. 1052]CAH1079381.1 multidrug efflux pump membrane fusion protein MdtA [Candidatus Nitrotoga sp. 1052]